MIAKSITDLLSKQEEPLGECAGIHNHIEQELMVNQLSICAAMWINRGALEACILSLVQQPMFELQQDT